MDIEGFDELYIRLKQIDYFGTRSDILPQREKIDGMVLAAAKLLPFSYDLSYAQPLEQALPRLLALVEAQKLPDAVMETFAGAVYEHNLDFSLLPHLQRFLAVVSNVYRSFTSPDKRKSLGVPVVEKLPPLAVFQSSGSMGPFTVVYEESRQLIGSNIGIASLPATYASDPLLWAILAHETGGHSVTHADPGLIDELKLGISSALSSVIRDGAVRDQLALLWSFWLDEATADVCGVLNIGPMFSANMMAYFCAARAGGSAAPPTLRMTSAPAASDPALLLDSHPTDIARPFIALGAINSMPLLSEVVKEEYLNFIESLARHVTDSDAVSIKGRLPIDRDHYYEVDLSVPLTLMSTSAYAVGGYIATTQLHVLGGHSLQEIETWDDSDEERARIICDAILSGSEIVALGDDAHLLAGTTRALLTQPSLYRAASSALERALDDSFQRDPIWGQPSMHPVLTVYNRQPGPWFKQPRGMRRATSKNWS